MKITLLLQNLIVLGLLLAPVTVSAFQCSNRLVCRRISSTSSLFMAKKRKARQTQQVEKTRPDSFYEAMDAKEQKKKDVANKEKPVDPTDAEREAKIRASQERMEQRPVVSTMIVDEETGMEIVQQGKSVMDVITRKAVVLSPLGPQYRLAQLFPGVPPEIRQGYRFDWTTVNVPTMVQQLRAACMVNGEIPPHPSVANKAIDFVLANRDYLGYKMKRTLGRLTMRAMSMGNIQEGKQYQALWKNFLTLENHISAPFRQMVMDAEGRVGPNFGNLDVGSFCKGELYERTANYLVLKGMVAHWEKKVVDADFVEKTPQTKENYMRVLARGDPKRYLPDPPILFTLRECTQVCYMAQQMTKTFVETPELFNDLPPEVRFLEQALSIKGGTALRMYMIQDFCPAEGITPEGLREGLRRLYAQLENMQIDPYGDICNILQSLVLALSVGTEDERDPYTEYLVNKDPNSPGYFQSYTFDHEQLSLVRFLDGQYERAGAAPTQRASSSPFGALFGGLGGGGGGNRPDPMDNAPAAVAPKAGSYKVPEVRSMGRPQEVGWLEYLKGETTETTRLGKIPPGKIIMEQAPSQ